MDERAVQSDNATEPYGSLPELAEVVFALVLAALVQRGVEEEGVPTDVHLDRYWYACCSHGPYSHYAPI